MNEFGGNWTQEKIEIFMKYLPAYLTIMNSEITTKYYASNWKLLYFDGFAGSGAIVQDGTELDFLEGVASRVLSNTKPRGFDMYVFVELASEKAAQLRQKVEDNFVASKGKVWVMNENFNDVAFRLGNFLRNNKNYKCLAFIDPYGMQVNWSSLEAFKKLSMDAWILIPTGMGVNRLLTKNGQIENIWLQRLQTFLGLTEAEIKAHFYQKKPTLFGDEEQKQENAIEKVHELYKKRLMEKEIFKYVSDAYVMRNSQNSIMYHFLLCSNNKTAVQIANEIVGKSISKLPKFGN